MSKNPSIQPENKIKLPKSGQIKSSRSASASKKENKTNALINELKTGEKSGMIENFDADLFLNLIHQKYLKR